MIDKLQYELNNDKIVLKRALEYLSDQQNKFKEDYARLKNAPNNHEKRY